MGAVGAPSPAAHGCSANDNRPPLVCAARRRGRDAGWNLAGTLSRAERSAFPAEFGQGFDALLWTRLFSGTLGAASEADDQIGPACLPGGVCQHRPNPAYG